MKQHLLNEILKLSVAERIQLAGDIWDSVSHSPEAMALSDAQCEELDRRMEFHRNNPGVGVTWDALHERLLARI